MVPDCNNAFLTSKGSYGNGKPKNVILDVDKKAHFAVRVCKMPVFMMRGVVPTVQISRNSGFLLTMVP